MAAAAREDDLPEHLFRWLEAVQRRVSHELDLVLDDAARTVGPRRLRILQLVPAAGTSQQDLAERALVTKQAMAELIDALERAGLVERRPDPRDGRAWLVVRSVEGDRISDALDVAMTRVEDILRREVGNASYSTFLEVLHALGHDQI